MAKRRGTDGGYEPALATVSFRREQLSLLRHIARVDATNISTIIRDAFDAYVKARARTDPQLQRETRRRDGRPK